MIPEYNRDSPASLIAAMCRGIVQEEELKRMVERKSSVPSYGQTVDRVLRVWERQPQFLLCRESGCQAYGGMCHVHGGDACLFVYVQVASLNRALRSTLENAKMPPPPREGEGQGPNR